MPSLNESRQPEIVAAVIVMMALSTIAVVLRLISRKISAARIGIDDGLMVLALVSLPVRHDSKRTNGTEKLFTYGLAIDCFVAVHYGFGLHTIRLSLSDVVNYAKVGLHSPKRGTGLRTG